MLVLPSAYVYNTRVMLWTVGTFTPVVNGSSSLIPTSQSRIKETALQIPEVPGIDYLRAQGIRSVVVLRDDVRDTPAQRLLGVRDEQLPSTVTRVETTDAVTFILKPA